MSTGQCSFCDKNFLCFSIHNVSTLGFKQMFHLAGYPNVHVQLALVINVKNSHELGPKIRSSQFEKAGSSVVFIDPQNLASKYHVLAAINKILHVKKFITKTFSTEVLQAMSPSRNVSDGFFLKINTIRLQNLYVLLVSRIIVIQSLLSPLPMKNLT